MSDLGGVLLLYLHPRLVRVLPKPNVNTIARILLCFSNKLSLQKSKYRERIRDLKNELENAQISLLSCRQEEHRLRRKVDGLQAQTRVKESREATGRIRETLAKKVKVSFMQ